MLTVEEIIAAERLREAVGASSHPWADNDRAPPDAPVVAVEARRSGVPRYCGGPCCAGYARQTAQSASGEKSGTPA